MALVDLILRLQKGEPLTSQEMDNNLSNLLAGIVQSSCDWAGSQEPEETFPYLRWIDTSTNPPTNKIRNAEDDDWITLGSATTPLGAAATLDVGTEPNEIPTNDDLGSAAYINHEDLPISTATQAALETKVDKVEGKNLSTEDYTSADKAKLQGVEAGAQVNTVTSVAGRAGAVALSKSDVGLSNVDNTSDANKPVSTAQATALAGKANVSHTHTWTQVTDAPATATRWPTWSEVTSKPSTFTPSSHTHTAGQVTGLGTAATRNVTTSRTDTTAGSVLKVGDFGIGGFAINAVGDWNNYNNPGVYMGSGLDNAPWVGWAYVHCYQHNPMYTTQVAYSLTGAVPRMAIRIKSSDTWGSWVENYHTGNTGTAATRNVGTGLNDIPTVSYVDTQKVISNYNTISNSSSGSLVIGQSSVSLNLTSGLQVGFRLDIVGPLTINTPSGETLRSQYGSNSVMEDGGATLIKLNSNTWWLAGNLE